MSSQCVRHPAIEKYLAELELAAKQCVGVHPNQILRDVSEQPIVMSSAKSQGLSLGAWPIALVAVLVLFPSLIFGFRSLIQDKSVPSKAPGLQTSPSGWQVVSEVEVKSQQLEQFSKKLKIPLSKMFNTVVRFEGQNLQINTITARSEVEAGRLKETLRQGKSNPRWVVQNGSDVYELVVRSAEDARLAAKARYTYPIEPIKRSYEVSFDAIPIQSEPTGAAPDARNRLFNLLLQVAAKPSLTSELESLANGYKFADEIELVSDLQKQVLIDWKSKAAKVSPQSANSELTRLKIDRSETKFGMPSLNLTASISINASQPRMADSQLDQAALLVGNARFPTDSVELRRIVSSLISSSDTDAVKLRKLLNWFAETKNIKYDGLTGSRYGTEVVIKQHYGRCWDYSDLFISMARIAGLPCRQVYGWIYESEGHVWCDVIINGYWQMVDPTSGTIVGSDYLPFCVSADGEFPILYASKVSIRVNSLAGRSGPDARP